jgi:hypothetical protein
MRAFARRRCPGHGNKTVKMLPLAAASDIKRG